MIVHYLVLDNICNEEGDCYENKGWLHHYPYDCSYDGFHNTVICCIECIK